MLLLGITVRHRKRSVEKKRTSNEMGKIVSVARQAYNKQLNECIPRDSKRNKEKPDRRRKMEIIVNVC